MNNFICLFKNFMSDFLQWAYDNRTKIGLDILAGSFSGMCNILSSHPMDTIKVRM